MTSLQQVISALRDRDCAPKEYAGAWSAICPIHHDETSTLYIWEGPDEDIHILCRVPGCSLGSICDAIEIDPSELINSKSVVPFREFPTEVLPDPIREFIEQGSIAIGCSSSYLALPLLSALAAAIGGTRQLRLKSDWKVPAIIWTAIVGESGTAKTPAFNRVMKYVVERQRKSFAQYEKEMTKYNVALARYEKDRARWNRDKTDTKNPPIKPNAPKAMRNLVEDTTVEALIPLLMDNPRGVLLARDELNGWIGSFDRYATGSGSSDESKWLSMHSGGPIFVDRKTGDQTTLHVPRACVSITGGIQPGILQRALGNKHIESGLAARILYANPPRKQKDWTEAEIAPELDAQMSYVFNCLYDMKPEVDQNGIPCPSVLDITPDAKSLYKVYSKVHGEEQRNQSGALSAAWSKLEEYTARFALVIHCVRVAAGDPEVETPEQVDAKSMEVGIRLIQWFKVETVRFYRMLSASKNEKELNQLYEWAQRRGGTVTTREVQQGHRKYETAQDAELALDELEKSGLADWVTKGFGSRGRPTRKLVLREGINSQSNTWNTVDVDSVDTLKTNVSDTDQAIKW